MKGLQPIFELNIVQIQALNYLLSVLEEVFTSYVILFFFYVFISCCTTDDLFFKIIGFM